MDTKTGKIRETDLPTLQEVLIDMTEATAKQKREMRVSIHDHRSKLGKHLTAERARRGLTKNQYRKLRKQGRLK